MTGRDAEREQLATALLAATTDYGTGKASPEVDLFDFYADALLPVVDRIANQRAAAELDCVADDVRARFGWAGGYGNEVRDRAAALRASNGEGT